MSFLHDASSPRRWLSLALLATLLPSWNNIGVMADGFDTAVKQAMVDLKIRGAAVTFISPNITIARGYGKVAASEESQDVTADTAFQMASVSKVFAGSAVAVLVDMGLIDLDDDICDALPASQAASSACINPAFPDVAVTWRMLLTHRSSLTEEQVGYVEDMDGNLVSAVYGPMGGYNQEAAGNPTCPLTDVKGFYRDIMIDKESETLVGRDGLLVPGGEPLDWYQVTQMDLGGVWNINVQPGNPSGYSNFAFGYVAALVEHVVDQPFDEFFDDHIAAPLDMPRTSWFREDLPEDTLVAVPVHALPNRGSWRDVGHYCYIDYTSGQLYSTANDLVLWGQSMLNKGVPELWSNVTSRGVFGCQERDAQGNRVDVKDCQNALAWFLLDNSSKEEALSGGNDGSDDDSVGNDYGGNDDRAWGNDDLSFRQRRRRLSSWLEPFADLDWTDGAMHEGGEEGILTIMIVLPNAGVFASVLLNTSDIDEDAALELLRIVANSASQAVVEDASVTERASGTASSSPSCLSASVSYTTLSLLIICLILL